MHRQANEITMLRYYKHFISWEEILKSVDGWRGMKNLAACLPRFLVYIIVSMLMRRLGWEKKYYASAKISFLFLSDPMRWNPFSRKKRKWASLSGNKFQCIWLQSERYNILHDRESVAWKKWASGFLDDACIWTSCKLYWISRTRVKRFCRRCGCCRRWFWGGPWFCRCGFGFWG